MKTIRSIYIILFIITLLIIAPMAGNAYDAEVSASIPLIILDGPTLSNLTSSKVNVGWTTNGNSSSVVYYRILESTNFISSIGKFNNVHLVSLSGLISDTTYKYYVESTLPGIPPCKSVPSTFKTAGNRIRPGESSGGDKYSTVFINNLQSDVPLRLDSRGFVEKTISISTPDKKVRLNISQGTKLLDSYGRPLVAFNIHSMSLLSPPPGYTVIMAVSFEPEGGSSVPPLDTTFTYDPDSLPQYIVEKDLFISRWDGSIWSNKLESTYNLENHSISFKLEHFSIYAVLGKKVVTTEVPYIPTTTPIVIAQPLITTATSTTIVSNQSTKSEPTVEFSTTITSTTSNSESTISFIIKIMVVLALLMVCGIIIAIITLHQNRRNR